MVSEQESVSSRKNFKRTGIPFLTSMTSGAYPPPWTLILTSWIPLFWTRIAVAFRLEKKKYQFTKTIRTIPAAVIISFSVTVFS